MDDQAHLYSEFLASITHEFRTPLAAMKASIELLQRQGRYLSQSEVDELLGSLHLSVSSLQTLVDNLLESAKIESGHFALTRRRLVFNETLTEAIQIIQPLIDRRRQALTLTEPLRLPPINADPVRLVQVIVNLLSNACSYSPLGETIDLALEIADNRLRFSVADHGAGVPLEVSDQLFRRFVRHDTDRDNETGVGLGLSVVKAIIEGHGGSVGVRERSGGGAVFWFTLPLTGSDVMEQGA